MENKKLHIAYLGFSGFPIGFAEVQKIKLVSKSLIQTGCEVIVINRKGVRPENTENISSEGHIEGVHYIYTSGIYYQSNSFLKRNWFKIVGAIMEVVLLTKLANKDKLDAAIISSKNFPLVSFYWLLSKLLNFKLLLFYVEHVRGIKEEQKTIGISSLFFDKYVFNFVDAVAPISDFLVQTIRKNHSKIPILKVPVLCDFQWFEGVSTQENGDNYFLFCLAYNKELVDFTLKSFHKIENLAGFKLYLVVSGGSTDMQNLRRSVDSCPLASEIVILSKLPYEKLVSLYMSAKGLLIPLRPTIRDIARFPHKIGEYTASGNPIITTNIGEIKNYFTDMENALVAETYNINEFAEKLQFVINNPEKSLKIGINGKKIGLANFDYLVYGNKIKLLLQSLRSQ